LFLLADRQLEAFKVLRDQFPDKWRIIKQRQNIFWTASSNQIEGSSLNFRDTFLLLTQGVTVQGKPFGDYLMARGHAKAIEIVEDVVANAAPVTETFLREVNALVLEGNDWRPAINQAGQPTQRQIQPGRYKELANHVLLPDGGLHTYLEPMFVAEEMERLIGFCNRSDLSPVAQAALAHYNFVRIHPFDDGNGRGARLLMNTILARAGFPPAIIRFSDRDAYITALEGANEGDTEAFVRFIAQCLNETLADIIRTFDNDEPNGVRE
jgi:Fic family protein